MKKCPRRLKESGRGENDALAVHRLYADIELLQESRARQPRVAASVRGLRKYDLCAVCSMTIWMVFNLADGEGELMRTECGGGKVDLVDQYFARASPLPKDRTNPLFQGTAPLISRQCRTSYTKQLLNPTMIEFRKDLGRTTVVQRRG